MSLNILPTLEALSAAAGPVTAALVGYRGNVISEVTGTWNDHRKQFDFPEVTNTSQETSSRWVFRAGKQEVAYAYNHPLLPGDTLRGLSLSLGG